MKGQNTKDLSRAIDTYLGWMSCAQYRQSNIDHYQRILHHFNAFAKSSNIALNKLFSSEGLAAFEAACGLTLVRTPVKGLAQFLYENNQLEVPMKTPPERLPDIYDQYLAYYENTRNVHHTNIRRCRNVFLALNRHLDDNDLSKLTIEKIDRFLKHHNAGYSPGSQRHHRSCVRGLLRYLYCQKIIRRDLATFLTAPPFYAQVKPPRFLRPEEVERFFSSLRWDRPKDIRCNAMIYPAYTLGLRPKEISLISLDDISFVKKEIILPNRKNTVALHLPLPEETLKAIIVYITHARPKTNHRSLFVTFTAPYHPVSRYTVSYDISASLRQAGIAESAYCLRHTYAQNLLEAGASIFQVKEMLGHDRIQTTRRYIHVHTQLMRKWLFNETL